MSIIGDDIWDKFEFMESNVDLSLASFSKTQQTTEETETNNNSLMGNQFDCELEGYDEVRNPLCPDCMWSGNCKRKKAQIYDPSTNNNAHKNLGSTVRKLDFVNVKATSIKSKPLKVLKENPLQNTIKDKNKCKPLILGTRNLNHEENNNIVLQHKSKIKGLNATGKSLKLTREGKYVSSYEECKKNLQLQLDKGLREKTRKLAHEQKRNILQKTANDCSCLVKGSEASGKEKEYKPNQSLSRPNKAHETPNQSQNMQKIKPAQEIQKPEEIPNLAQEMSKVIQEMPNQAQEMPKPPQGMIKLVKVMPKQEQDTPKPTLEKSKPVQVIQSMGREIPNTVQNTPKLRPKRPVPLFYFEEADKDETHGTYKIKKAKKETRFHNADENTCKISNDIQDCCKTLCKICNQPYPLNHMRKHTLSQHKLQITKYKEIHGPFVIIDVVYHKCQICERLVLLDSDTLGSHIKTHKVKVKRYYDQYIVKT